MDQEQNANYFQEALSDFMHDAASGGAIRHLLDAGYTTEAIMQKLDFPTPRARVEKTVYRYLTEKGILLEHLPFAKPEFRQKKTEVSDARKLCGILRGYVCKNGEENAYVACPFGTIRRDREARLSQMFACLTQKERDYLLGIPWPPQIIYHRLDGRMMELSVCMAIQPQAMKFYFLKTKETLLVNSAGAPYYGGSFDLDYL